MDTDLAAASLSTRKCVALAVFAALVIALAVPIAAHAAACHYAPVSAVQFMAVGTYTSFSEQQGDTAKLPWVKVGYAGTGYGTKFDCQIVTAVARLRILVPTANTVNRSCVFESEMGVTCQIRGVDGLPVELLRFGVE